MNWNEQKMQDALYKFCFEKRHEFIVPNSCVFGWEADMIGVTQTGFIHEFEIKISRSDFLADRKKTEKLDTLLTGTRNVGFFVRNVKPADRPNHFWYVVPDGLVLPTEIPSHAGLIYIYERHGTGWPNVEKEAPRIHKDKINEWQRRQLHRALTARYWHQRLNAVTNERGEFEI